MVVSNLHHLDSDRVHTRFRPDLEPMLTVESGDSVEIRCRDGLDGQADPPAAPADLDRNLYGTIDFGRVAPLTGPVAVRGAEPGDTLEVHIVDIVPFGTGSVVIWPAWAGYDFLPGEDRREFPHAWIRSFDMDEAWRRGYVEFRPGVRLPLRPMMGIIATAPAEGDYPTGPPREFGGNMDVKDVCKGHTVYLPVFRPGALFSTGDAHAVQGDGEVCTTGIETPVTVTVTFHLHRGRTIPAPQIETPDELMTVAYGRTLEDASRRAIGFMMDYLVERHGLSRHEAYALVGLVCDLRVNQVVDFPHLGVRVALPKRVFDRWRW